MTLTVFQRLQLMARKIPVVRNIPAFHTLPPTITTANLRFYKLGNFVYTLGWMAHFSWIVLFGILQEYAMVGINVASVLVYVLAITVNRRGHQFGAATIMVCEIIAHQVLAVQLIGWEAGFQYYMIVIVQLPFMMPRGRWGLKSVLMAACLFGYLFMDYYLKDQTPVYTIPEGYMVYLSVSNTLFAFGSMALGGAYFNLAMHETEHTLEVRSGISGG